MQQPSENRYNHRKPSFFIRKATGEFEPFSEKKLQQSLRRSGATEAAIDQILKEIESQLKEGETTGNIYKKAYRLLRKQKKSAAARYKLKNAIMELGPSGFPFEQFVGEILKRMGYSVNVGVIVNGHCVRHEVDVVAERGAEHFLVECKFHNSRGTKSDVKVALYVNARFHDIRQHREKDQANAELFHQMWLVTNTHFTTDAIQYGTCAGMRLLGWNYPDKNSLKDLIDQYQLFPITALSTLTRHEKEHLLSRKIVLARDLLHTPQLMRETGVPAARVAQVIKEVRELCTNC